MPRDTAASPRCPWGRRARRRVPGDDPLGPRRLAAAFAAESADDALPFELDVEEDGFAARDGAGGAVATFRETSESDPDAAVAALVRALRWDARAARARTRERRSAELGGERDHDPGGRQAPPGGHAQGSGRGPSPPGRRVFGHVFFVPRLLRRGKAGGAAEAFDPGVRAGAGAGAENVGRRKKKKSNPEASRADEAKSLGTAASIAIDAAVDEALAFAAFANGR